MHLLIIFGLLGSAFAGSLKYGGIGGGFKGGSFGGGIGGGGFGGGGIGGGSFGGGIGGGSFGGGIGGGSFGGGIGGGGFKGGIGGGGFKGGIGGGIDESFGKACGDGLVVNVDGSCVKPIVSRNIFVYSSPEIPFIDGPPVEIPPPKVDYNIVFVRTPEGLHGLEPIVVPPPQQKTLVYVLNKNGLIGGQKIIEVPAGHLQSPEVFYINYDDGDNPSLPGGISLQEALSSANAQIGQVIEGGHGGGHGGGFGGGHGGGFGGGLGGEFGGGLDGGFGKGGEIGGGFGKGGGIGGAYSVPIKSY